MHIQACNIHAYTKLVALFDKLFQWKQDLKPTNTNLILRSKIFKLLMSNLV